MNRISIVVGRVVCGAEPKAGVAVTVRLTSKGQLKDQGLTRAVTDGTGLFVGVVGRRADDPGVVDILTSLQCDKLPIVDLTIQRASAVGQGRRQTTNNHVTNTDRAAHVAGEFLKDVSVRPLFRPERDIRVALRRLVPRADDIFLVYSVGAIDCCPTSLDADALFKAFQLGVYPPAGFVAGTPKDGAAVPDDPAPPPGAGSGGTPGDGPPPGPGEGFPQPGGSGPGDGPPPGPGEGFPQPGGSGPGDGPPPGPGEGFPPGSSGATVPEELERAVDGLHRLTVDLDRIGLSLARVADGLFAAMAKAEDA